MKKIGVLFDANGLFAGDCLEDMETPEGYTLFDGDVPEGLYAPKLVGDSVVEGKAQAEIDAIVNAPIPSDPDVELAEAITNATTLAELKTALLGNGGLARVKGKLK